MVCAISPIVEHRGGGAVRVSIEPDSVDLRAGECFLLPPDRPYQAAWNSVRADLTTLSFEDLQRDALGLVDQKTVNLDFTRPVTAAAGRHWSQTIRYVQSFVSNSPLLAAAPLARRELGWLVSSAVLACFPNSTLDAESPSYAGDTPQPLRRALAFIDEHAGDPITLNEIAIAARLSPRGLAGRIPPPSGYHATSAAADHSDGARPPGSAACPTRRHECGRASRPLGIHPSWPFCRRVPQALRPLPEPDAAHFISLSVGSRSLRSAAGRSIPAVARRRRFCSGCRGRPGGAD